MSIIQVIATNLQQARKVRCCQSKHLAFNIYHLSKGLEAGLNTRAIFFLPEGIRLRLEC